MNLTRRLVSLFLTLACLATFLPAHATFIPDTADAPVPSAKTLSDAPADTAQSFLSDVVVSSTRTSISVTLTAVQEAKLVVALYESSTAMFDISVTPVRALIGEQTLTVDISAGGREEFTVKAFLLHAQDSFPLCQ